MTRAKIILAALLIALLPLAVAGGIWLGREVPSDRTARPASPAPETRLETPGTVTASRDAQKESGIATQAAQSSTLHPSTSGYATVVDLQPLIALSKRMVTAEAEVRSAQAAESTTQQELQRARALYADDRNVSRKTVEQAEASERATEAHLEVAQADLREARAMADQQYGAPLAAWATQPASRDFERLASRKRVLVAVVLPDESGAQPPRNVILAAPGYERAAAKLLSPSPRSDPLSAGRTFLYLSQARYPAGLALEAQIPLGAKPIEGFLVPESAVIWYGNEAWVFVQQSAERFVRRALRQPQVTPHGIFTTTAFASGERIVTTGAQLLHSEELRPKTSAASACDDPDCD